MVSLQSIPKETHINSKFLCGPQGEGGQNFTWLIMYMGVLYMLSFFRLKISKHFEDILKGSASNNDVMMTDLQKKLYLFLYGTG